MPSGDLLRVLLRSYKRRDDQAFEEAARRIISDERAKQHHLLADELQKIMDGDLLMMGRQAPVAGLHRFGELPKDRERNSNLVEVREPSKSLDEIILSEENRALVSEIVREFERSDILGAHGMVPRRRLLFCGPPGCGKTVSAEAIAQELRLPLLYTRLDSIISSYLGETAANLRRVFDFASRGTWVVFFDEFDAIGKSRDDANEHGELKRVINSFLQLLDGFRGDSLVIAATNHQGLLDGALWRRFDEVAYFGPPSESQIATLINLNLRSVRHSDIDLSVFVPQLMGLSFADIERICLDAMRYSLLGEETELSFESFTKAVERQRRRATISADSTNAFV